MITRALLAITTVVAMLAVEATPARGAFPDDPEAPGLRVCADQYPFGILDHSACSDGEGGLIVTWIARTSESLSEVHAQRVDAEGRCRWGSSGVRIAPSDLSHAAGQARIVSDDAGGAIVVWSEGGSTNPSDLRLQRIDADGELLWKSGGVIITGSSSPEQFLLMDADGLGGAVVAWCDARTQSLDVYAQRLHADGTPIWLAGGVPVSQQTGSQALEAVVHDGSGGAFLAWTSYDEVNAHDAYVGRVSASGQTIWGAAGVALSTLPFSQLEMAIAPDGAGGIYASWSDPVRGLKAQHVSSSGSPLWIPAATHIADETISRSPSLASDGSGGAILAWQLGSSIMAQRISGTGPFPTLHWGFSAVTVSTAAGAQHEPRVVGLQDQESIITWVDESGLAPGVQAQRLDADGQRYWEPNGRQISDGPGSLHWSHELVVDGTRAVMTVPASLSDVFAQRLDRSGLIGHLGARSMFVEDVPADQGRRVSVSWQPSRLDTLPVPGIATYRLWRAAPEWVLDTTIIATGATAYQTLRPTTADSNVTGIPHAVFRIEALATEHGAGPWWTSPDSGYSVDDLPPASPAAFAAIYEGGATHLTWNPNSEADLWYYALHRGSTAEFTPDAGNRIAATVALAHDDVGPAGSFYKLAAVDVNGNVSGYTLILPPTTSTPNAGALALSLTLAGGNPSRGAHLRFAITLTNDAPARLELLDVHGRRMAEHSLGALGAGRHTVQLVASSVLRAGVYVARLTQGEQVRVLRAVVTD